MPSPYSSGGGGTHFEARVVAYYLTAALAEAPARGVPGLRVTSVLTQRAAFDEPLDDLIVHGVLADGQSSKLALQVKSTLTFTENDTEWIAVLGQAWDTFGSSAFDDARDRIGVAISSYNARADKYYQSVLNWATNSPNGADFLQRIAREDFSHKDQRTFVATTRKLLADHSGASVSDDATWRFLRAFRIVHFDFDSQDASRDVASALDRLRNFLPIEQRAQAGAIWGHLIAAAGEIDPAGGGATRATLAAGLRSVGLPSGQGTTYWHDLQTINLETERALASMKGDIHGIRLNRIRPYEQVQEALGAARFVQIDGEPGSGKTALLKQLAEEAALAGPVFLLKDIRILPRGWSAHAGQLGIASDLVGLLSELGSVSESTLFIDGIDKVNDPAAQLTVNDLVRAIASEPALSRWKILVTVREQNLDHIATWLDPDALKRLPVRSVTMPTLSAEELSVISAEFPRLGPLLRESGNVDVILRRPFFLEAVLSLSGRDGTTALPATEVELLNLWWSLGGAAEQAGFTTAQRRRNVLLDLAERLVSAPTGPISIRDLPPEPLDDLRSAGVIRNRLMGHSVTFSHDIYEEWALCEWLLGQLPDIAQALKSRGEPQALIRPLQLVGSHELETHGTEIEWQRLYEKLSEASLRPVWQRAVLTSCLRSTRSTETLAKLANYLHRNNDDGLRKLLNALQTLEVVPNARFLDEAVLPDLDPDERVRFAHANAWPKLLTWIRFLDWYIPHAVEPSPSLIPDLLPIFSTWQSACSGQNIRHCRRIGEISHGWLLEFEAALHPASFHDRRNPFGVDFDHDEERDLEGQIRNLFLSSAGDVKDLVATYLDAKAHDPLSHMYRDKILAVSGILARTMPKEVVDYVIAALLTHPKDVDDRNGYSSIVDDNLGIEGNHSFDPASPNQPPFLSVLRKDEYEGLRLVKRICNHSVDVWRWSCQRRDYHREARTPLPIEIDFPWGKQQFWGDGQVYVWFRGTWGNDASRSALMALELWALERIDAGDEFAQVFRKVLDGSESVAALGLAVSLCLAHQDKSVESALPLITCPHIWQWDIARMVHDQGTMQANEMGDWRRYRHLLSAVRDLNRRPHRKACIRDMVPYFVFWHEPSVKERYVAGIRSFVDRLPFTYAEERSEPEIEAALRKAMSWYVEQADPQFWHIEPSEDGKHIKFWNDPPSAKSQERVQQLESSAQQNRYLRLALWAQKSLEGNQIDGGVTLAVALVEAQGCDFEGLFGATEDSFEEGNRRAAVAGTAYALARFAPTEVWTDDTAKWAYDTLHRAAAFRGVSNVTYRGTVLTMHPLIFAAHGFSGLLARRYKVTDCQHALLSLAVAPLEAVSEAVATSAKLYAAEDPVFHWAVFDLLVRYCIVSRDELPDHYSPRWSEAEARRNMALVEAVEAALTAGDFPPLPAVPMPWLDREGFVAANDHTPTGQARKPLRVLWSIAQRIMARLDFRKTRGRRAEPESLVGGVAATGASNGSLRSPVAHPWLDGEVRGVANGGASRRYTRNPLLFQWHIAQRTILRSDHDALLKMPGRRSEFVGLVGDLVEMTIQEVVPPFAKSRRENTGNIPFEWVYSLFHWLGKVAARLNPQEIDTVALGPVFATDNETALLAMHTLQSSYLAHALLPPAIVSDEAFATWEKIADWVIDNREGRALERHVDREFARCVFSLLFCFSGDFQPLICVVEEDWEPLRRFDPIVERVVKKFGTNPFLYMGVLRFLKKGGMALIPEPGLAWLHEIAVARKQDHDFWSTNGDETVEVLRLILAKKADSLSDVHRSTVSLITDIMVDNGVRGAGFLQQDQLRR